MALQIASIDSPLLNVTLGGFEKFKSPAPDFSMTSLPQGNAFSSGLENEYKQATLRED